MAAPTMAWGSSSTVEKVTNPELAITKTAAPLRLDPGTVLNNSSIAGTGSTGVHVSATVIAGLKLTGSRVRIVGGRITGVPTVSSKEVIGIHIAGASQARIGGTKIDGLHAGIWMGGGAVEPTLQNVEVSGNEHNILSGYQPTTSSSPQVSRPTLINVTATGATVGDGLQLYSYTDDVRIFGGTFNSNAGWGINGYVGGGTVEAIGAQLCSNTAGGVQFTYGSLSGTIANKLGYAKKGTLIGNRACSNSGPGFSVQLTDYSAFSTIGGVEDMLLADNLSDNNVGVGFDLGLVRSSVTGNRSLNNQGNCFTIRSNKSTTYSGNQAWDCGTSGTNRRGFEFLTAATTGSPPPNSTLITFTGNQAGDTRSGGSRYINFAFDLNKLDSGSVTDNFGSNANTADWFNINGLSSVSFTNNRGSVSGSSVLGTPWGKHISATATWDPASLGTNAETSTTLTVTGAAVGDVAMCGHTQVTADLLQLSCYVSAADTVRAVLENISAGTIDVSSGTLRAEVWKP